MIFTNESCLSTHRIHSALPVLWMVLFSTQAAAAEIKQLDVQHQQGRYSMTVNAHLEAPTASVYEVLTDYDQFERVADAIVEARILEHSGPRAYLVYTKLKSCFLLLCLEKEKTEQIELRSDVEVLATLLPERSDFRSGTTHWVLTPDSEGTRIHLELAIEPNFWVPPLIGPSIIKSVMRQEGTNSAHTVERLAIDSTPQ